MPHCTSLTFTFHWNSHWTKNSTFPNYIPIINCDIDLLCQQERSQFHKNLDNRQIYSVNWEARNEIKHGNILILLFYKISIQATTQNIMFDHYDKKNLHYHLPKIYATTCMKLLALSMKVRTSCSMAQTKSLGFGLFMLRGINNENGISRENLLIR